MHDVLYLNSVISHYEIQYKFMRHAKHMVQGRQRESEIQCEIRKTARAEKARRRERERDFAWCQRAEWERAGSEVNRESKSESMRERERERETTDVRNDSRARMRPTVLSRIANSIYFSYVLSFSVGRSSFSPFPT